MKPLYVIRAGTYLESGLITYPYLHGPVVYVEEGDNKAVAALISAELKVYDQLLNEESLVVEWEGEDIRFQWRHPWDEEDDWSWETYTLIKIVKFEPNGENMPTVG